MNEKLNELCIKRDLVVILRGLANDGCFRMLLHLIGSDSEKLSDFLADYSDFVSELYSTGNTDLSEHLLKILLEDDNICIRTAAKGKSIPPEMQESLLHELQFVQELSQLTPEDFLDEIDYDGYLPRWKTSPIDIPGSYSERMRLIGKYGYGKFAANVMFTVDGGEAVPVKFPDPQRLSDLYGYERERQAVIRNTLALLEGRHAQNVLLYGDAGTGKSSTVKAVVNEFSDRGLRLIEITKDQLRDMPKIIGEISDDPLKFIIFIDDLSFAAGEDCFGALKAVLEGSAAARADNMAIYATSNRRHLVKESFSDREGDDIHRNDTMQEMLSLSSRFGLRVNFSRPGKNDYTEIAKRLAQKKGIELPGDEIALKAEQFAISSGNGRSPRTAKQFIHQLINELAASSSQEAE